MEVWKPHLLLKRFQRKDLTPGARRNHEKYPYDAKFDIAKVGTSICHVCQHKIPKGEPRLCLMLQCHKGYKTPAYLHAFTCAWLHPETRKLEDWDEIIGKETLDKKYLKKLRMRHDGMLVAQDVYGEDAFSNVTLEERKKRERAEDENGLKMEVKRRKKKTSSESK